MKRCGFIVCATMLLALVAQQAHAQRVRFGPPDDPAAASGGVSVAARTDRAGSSGTGWTAAGSGASTSSNSLAGSPPPVDIYSQTSSAPPSYTYVAAPPTSSQAVVYGSPAASYGSSVPAGPSPQWMASAWDPYLVASRQAAFSGTIQSAAAAGPQFIVPQPQPRVPYYTQQPVAAAAPTAGQPYVVIPEANCSAPPVMQSAPVVMPNLTNTTVLPQQVAPTATPFVVPPTIPTLAPTTALPLSTPHCYAQADGIFFTRDAQIGNQPIVLLDGNTPTQSNVLLSTADLDFDFEVGPRILLGREWDGFRMFEASYFGIYNWEADSTINGDNNLNLPGDLGLFLGLDFFNADQATAQYKSIIHNAEFNYLHTYGNIAWLIGFRYFNLQDKLFITFTDEQTGSSHYNISAYNNLFGGQIGGRIWQSCGNWSYDLTGKSGVYDNVIRSSQNVTDFDNFTARNTSTSANQIAFIGDLEFNANYQFTPTWSIRGGYQVFWIEGLALAPNQLDYSIGPDAGTNLNKTGGLFMHGAHAGLMAKW